MSASPVRRAGAAEKRRIILDAAVRVFARQGFHTCRVADIADEAGVAYGLVYHYFASKDEILDTLFLERWDVLLRAIAEVDAGPGAAEEKLGRIAGFIVDSYARDPELMQVIIVEVTRAASTFGRTHIGKIREAYTGIAEIVAKAQRSRRVPRRHRSRSSPRWPSTVQSSRCSRAGSSTFSRLAMANSRHQRDWSWRRSAAVCGTIRRHDGKRPGEATHVVRPAGRDRRAREHRDHAPGGR